MNSSRIRFLFALLCIIAFCGAVQATNLLITVQDSLDNSTIPHATVMLNGVNVGMTDNAGQFLIQSGQGDLNLLISMHGYEDWSGIVGGNVTNLSVTLNRQSLVVNVSLFDSNSLAPVSGVSLFLTSSNTSQTSVSDATGSASFGVTSFTFYSLNITAPNYQPRSETIEVEDQDQNVQYWLLSENQYSFVVKDANSLAPVPGAVISVNGVLVGMTDSRGVLIFPISRNTPVSIQATKSGYQTLNQILTISSNEAVDPITLTPVPVTGFILVFDQQNKPINGASVSLDGTLLANTTEFGRATLQDLTPGTYTVVVSKAGYSPVSQKISIVNESSEFPVVLSPASVNQPLYVQDPDQKNVAGATVMLNGAVMGTTDSHGQIEIQLTYNTANNITVTDAGYVPQTVQQEVSFGNTTSPLTITLQRNMDWGFVTLVGIGILIVLFIFAVIRLAGRRNRHHVIKRNEI